MNWHVGNLRKKLGLLSFVFVLMVLFCFNNVTAYADTVSAAPYLNNAILEDEIELCIGTSTSIDVSNESGILINVQSKNENVAHVTLSGSQFYSVINVTAIGLGSTEIELVDSTENTVLDVLKVNVVGANVLVYFDTDNVSVVKGKTCIVSYTVDCDVSSDCYELGIVSRDISVATVETPYSYSNSFKITAVALGETIIDIVDTKNNNKVLASFTVNVSKQSNEITTQYTHAVRFVKNKVQSIPILRLFRLKPLIHHVCLVLQR